MASSMSSSLVSAVDGQILYVRISGALVIKAAWCSGIVIEGESTGGGSTDEVVKSRGEGQRDEHVDIED